MSDLSVGREGDSVVSRSEASEDTGVEVEDGASFVVVVGQERVKCHSLGRCEDAILVSGDYNYRKVSKRWVGQSIVFSFLKNSSATSSLSLDVDASNPLFSNSSFS